MYASILKGAPLGNCNAIGGKVGGCGEGVKGKGQSISPNIPLGTVWHKSPRTLYTPKLTRWMSMSKDPKKFNTPFSSYESGLSHANETGNGLQPVDQMGAIWKPKKGPTK